MLLTITARCACLPVMFVEFEITDCLEFFKMHGKIYVCNAVC